MFNFTNFATLPNFHRPSMANEISNNILNSPNEHTVQGHARVNSLILYPWALGDHHTHSIAGDIDMSVCVKLWRAVIILFLIKI
jgi:hypothetical protein